MVRITDKSLIALFRRFHLAALFLVLHSSLSFSQAESGLAGKNDIIQSYACTNNQQEHLFVFLNSGFYYPGEMISFNAVLFDDSMQIKEDGSRFFYLQVINRAGKSISNYTFAIQAGVCSGQIRLADSLYSGIYQINAYTRWMRNFGADNSFRRPFVVVSPLEGTELSAYGPEIRLPAFYPETGSLIAGAENRILIRVNPFQHDPIRQLRINDDQGNTIQTCSIDTNGVGVLVLNPEYGRDYYAVTTDSGKVVQSFKLPACNREGYGMNLINSGDQLTVSVYSAAGMQPAGQLYIGVLNGNSKKSFFRKISMGHNKGSLLIPYSQIPHGLSQFVVMDGDSVLCSKVWYRKNESCKSLAPEIKETVGTRETVSANYKPNASNTHEKLLAFSVNEFNPVTDCMLFDETSLFLYFDLYSGLSGPERLPVFHANTSEEYINECLMDYTQTRSWEAVFNYNGSYRYKAETQGIMFTGKVITGEQQLPVAGASVLLSHIDSSAHIDYSITNEKGEFSFILTDKYYNKKVCLVVMEYPHADKKIRIILDDPFELQATSGSKLILQHPAFESVFSGHKNVSMAYRVFYGAGKQNENLIFPVQSAREQHFYGKPEFTLVPAEYESLPDLFEIKRNLIPGLKLDVKDNYCEMSVFDTYLQMYYPKEALVLLNNIPYPSLKNILELNSDAIRNIDIKRNKYFFDNLLIYGIVAIYTRKLMQVEPYYSHIYTMAPILSAGDEIRKTELSDNTSLPDVRHSLYWETRRQVSGVIPEIRFRTSDIQGRYLLKMFSINEKGELCWTREFFTVL